MADGYARASGRAGVILAGQNGPGSTNLVTGLAQAAAAFLRLFLLPDHYPPVMFTAMPFKRLISNRYSGRSPKKPWTVTQTERVPKCFAKHFGWR